MVTGQAHGAYGPFGGAWSDVADVVAAAEPGAFTVEGPDRLTDRRGTLGRTPAAERFVRRLGHGRVVTVSLPSDATTVRTLARAAHALASVADAIVIGESAGRPDDLSPTYRAGVVQDAGAGVIVALTCRERNRVALEGELAALADLDVDAVLALSGTGARAVGEDAPPVFDLDAARLGLLARRAGHAVAVDGSAPSTADVRLIDDGPQPSAGTAGRAATMAVIPIHAATSDGVDAAVARARAAAAAGAAGIHLWVVEDADAVPGHALSALTETAARVREALS